MTLVEKPPNAGPAGTSGRPGSELARHPSGGQLPGDVCHGVLQSELAVERTMLAVERTYDAWIRTGLAALASGVGARALLAGSIPTWLSKSTGAMLVLFAACCFLIGAWREISTDSRLPSSHIRQLPPVALIVVNGFLMAVALATFIGVVVTR